LKLLRLINAIQPIYRRSRRTDETGVALPTPLLEAASKATRIILKLRVTSLEFLDKLGVGTKHEGYSAGGIVIRLVIQ
jgi:hypothetical protein